MIYEKLAEIQNELFVPKGQKNNFGNRFFDDYMKRVYHHRCKMTEDIP